MSAAPLVIYHDHCMDGFTAAWVVNRALAGECELLPASYSSPAPNVQGRDVLIVDFSYPRTELLRMAAEARSLLVLDHHKTAEEALADLPFATFDSERSGAGLAWDHFFPGVDRPWLVAFVEDRDLWRFALPGSRAINAYLRAIEPSLRAWDDLHRIEWVRDKNTPFEQLIGHGSAILAHIEQTARRTAERAGSAELAGHVVPIVNAGPELASEVGNLLSRAAPFAIVWSQDATGVYHYSLRSSREFAEHVDVAEVARALGGGGHRHAAGFTSATAVHRLV